jgi:drug/metabolite transporter (DMT)-like permease
MAPSTATARTALPSADLPPPGEPSTPVSAHPARARARARLLLFASAVFFGLAAALVRIAAGAGMSAGQVTLVRFSVGLAAIVPVFFLRKGTFAPRRPALLVARALFGGLAALLYFASIARIPAGEATLLNNTFPIFAVILSFFLLDERPTIHLAAALAVASAGVFLVVGGGSVSFRLGTGELLGIASGLLGGAAVTAIRALRVAGTPAPTVFFAFSLGGNAVSVPSVAAPWPGAWLPWVAALGVGLAAFLAQLAMTEAYGQLSVPEAALWQQLTPIASYLWGFALGEAITGTTAVGILLGVGGIVYGSAFGHRATPESPIAQAVPEIPAEEP